MEVAQRLYEGVDLPEGRTGLITYMRTDSTRVADQAVNAARAWIQAHFGKEFLPAKARKFRSAKTAQDAHEAIRPTDVQRTPETLRASLKPEEWKLYDLIWKRFIAGQMTPAEYDVTTVVVAAGEYELEARGEVLVKPGYRAVYGETAGDREPPETAGEEPRTERLPRLREGQVLQLLDLSVEQKFTQPPARFTEASLIRELEKRGIGRPSTYATILAVIQNRDYVTKTGQAFRPTALGRLVCEALERFFPDLMDYRYTARMEASLDRIESGRLDRRRLLSRFYRHFKKQLETAGHEMPSYKIGAPIDAVCPECGQGRLILRWSRNGGFLKCEKEDCGFKIDYAQWLHPEPEEPPGEPLTCPRCQTPMNFERGRHGRYAACPSCRLTVSVNGEAEPIRTDRACPEGHSPLVLKSGPYGSYYACIRDDCKGTRPVMLDLPCPRPGCGGEIVLRTYRKGRARRTFYGCSRYPECRFSTSGPIVKEPCPEGDAAFQVRVRGRLRCPNPECPRGVKPYPRRKKRTGAA